ncbi:hypothetical protein KFL_001590160 [Klebsormidium nitens]|uniref:Uncharacterized protein n=1 Tax=Klebsormidium nitens TaxID=105231 RepID=A0A1Y1I6L1_KLENI|nr:hypothetical protein KFL_001590160 [Klebsormidium nitens]|eukprot:GAQ83728.1 hypothetical protein KFL_001590160 [Klebsormidium nitens]
MGRKSSGPRRRSLRAVRVEDLSPAAPQPEEEEPVDVKVPVGFVGETSDTVFSVRKLLPAPSVLVTVTLPKPLGIVFEESRIRKRVVVADLIPGGNAEQAARVVQMFGTVRTSGRDGASARTGAAVQKGDVLRGLTTTQCIVDLFGVRAPRRASVYFDTKNRRWGEIMGAFGAVKVSDGEITLVLERKLERDQAPR